MISHLFPKDIYTKRRKRLAEIVNTGVILLLGNEESPMNYADNGYPFRQDSSFLYYFGIDIPSLAAVIDVDAGKEILFGQSPGMDDIIWTGALPSLEELASEVGVSQTTPFSQIATFLQNAKSRGQTIHFLPPYRAENKIKLSEWLGITLGGLPAQVSVPLIKAIVSQRQYKEACEVEEIEKAVSISADMHTTALQYAKAGMMEYEVAAKVEEVVLAANARLSYPIILTVNGQTLHNHYHGNKLRDGQMILMDAGAETSRHYAGDLTRTFPVGKSFTSLQKDMYNVVLHALDTAVSMLKPGVTFKEVHRQASIMLVKGLGEMNIVKGNPEEAVAEGVHTLFFQCGLGHMMGLDVHDMEDLGETYVGYSDTMQKSTEFGWKSLRLAKELQPGFVLTVEPGIYMIPELMDRWKAEKKLCEFVNYDVLDNFRHFSGIRIEDNFLITETGYKKLGKHLPRTAEEIEAFRQ